MHAFYISLTSLIQYIYIADIMISQVYVVKYKNVFFLKIMES